MEAVSSTSVDNSDDSDWLGSPVPKRRGVLKKKLLKQTEPPKKVIQPELSSDSLSDMTDAELPDQNNVDDDRCFE